MRSRGGIPHCEVCSGFCREALPHGPLVFLHVLQAEAHLSFILGHLFLMFVQQTSLGVR